jgi:SNF2 family DNA or RNA helicase
MILVLALSAACPSHRPHVQVEVYRGLLRSKRITSLLYGVGSCSDSEGILPAITVLKKLCNHPKLVYKEQQQQQGAAPGQQQQPQQQQQQSTNKACSKTAELAGSILQQHLPGVGLPLDAVKLSGALWDLGPCFACWGVHVLRGCLLSAADSALNSIV